MCSLYWNYFKYFILYILIFLKGILFAKTILKCSLFLFVDDFVVFSIFLEHCKADFITIFFSIPWKKRSPKPPKKPEPLTWFSALRGFQLGASPSTLCICTLFCCYLCWVFNENHIKSICTGHDPLSCQDPGVHSVHPGPCRRRAKLETLHETQLNLVPCPVPLSYFLYPSTSRGAGTKGDWSGKNLLNNFITFNACCKMHY